MFERLQSARGAGEKRRRWLISGAVAALFYGAVGAGVAWLVSSQPPAAEREVEVSFEKPVVKEVAATPPAAPLPPPPPPPSPHVPTRVSPVKPARPLTVPKEVPKEVPPEADPATSEPSGSPGDELGVPGGTGPVGAPPPPPPPPPPAPRPSGPVDLPAGATAPVPSRDNAMPEYPESERKTGREGLVILKVVVTDGGRVTHIQVLRGEEPFIAAALTAVKDWSYSPATLDGRPIGVYRILNIPFRISAGY